ncbi:hypothetical protein COY93_04075 [Candidatus Uhrbacteria bacterium CG_4_10_14_0_8_um_filter_58_22]|uniref:Uncharacterized protein n=1 Tax=Candidatus Uhrbacteria bacterium CG_4_10_14_0_8_um_filter_58_22 TaxID=1975029 RepID=A0A2M7Q931_9BACT|nr:MAG: hypothetical protein AUJ19_04350 [Parcubacteria group bacterium CG1_02_58_44]PIY62055.1 MAG: hypothetical protein COY93_04075 [Candidatus Uhrbacteria bacterium CG_4_10_14_0_8_um_filter_58_22]
MSAVVLATVIEIGQISRHRLYGICACLHFACVVLAGLNWMFFTSSVANGSALLSWFTLPVLYINLIGMAAHIIANQLLVSRHRPKSDT